MSSARSNLTHGDWLTIQDTQSGAYQATPQAREASGWLHATIRQTGTCVEMLTGADRFNPGCWSTIGRVDGESFVPAGASTLARNIRTDEQAKRLAMSCLLLSFIGYATPMFGDPLPCDPRYRLARAFPCEGNCGKLLSSGISTFHRLGPVCGGRVATPRTWAGVDMARSMLLRDGTQPTSAATTTTCPGTCDPDAYCPDCLA